jgi:excisionase family DNA binding protein
MERLFLKPAEAAELLGVGRTTVYTLIASGSLPAVRVGRSLRVPLAGLRAWAERRGTGTVTQHEPGSPEVG